MLKRLRLALLALFGKTQDFNQRELDMLLNAVEWIESTGGLEDSHHGEDPSCHFTSFDYERLNARLRDHGGVY